MVQRRTASKDLLTKVSVLIKLFWCPFLLFAQESVCEDNELSHDCYDRDFGWFLGFSEGVVSGLEVRVEADGDQGRHVERLAYDGPTAEDEARPDCLSLGARPESLPTAFASSSPSSGISMRWQRR